MNSSRKIHTTQYKITQPAHRMLLVLLISALLLSCSISYKPEKETGVEPNLTEETFITDIPPTPELPMPTPIPSEMIGTLTVTSEGGIFKGDGVTIEVGGGWVTEDLLLEVDRLDFSTGNDGDAASGYRLRGALYALPGSITITMPLMEGLQGDEGKDPSIALGGRVFAPSSGYVYVSRPLETQVDRVNGTVKAVLNLVPAAGGVGALPNNKVAAPRPIRPASNLALRDPAVEVDFRQMRPPKVEQIFESEHFSVRNLQVAVPESNLKALLVMLEKQRTLIQDLGFDFGTAKGRLLVWIEPLDPDRYGEFHPGIFSGDLSINRLHLKDENTFNQNKTVLSVTAAHELLHWVQWLYDIRDPFTRTFVPPATYSLDEATATWLEPLAAGNPDYLPGTAFDNRDFVFSPLLPQYVDAATAKEVQQRGYGASLYLRYLTKKIGSKFIPELHAFARTHFDTPSASVLDSVLNQNDLSFSDTYAAFLETLIANPAEIAPGLVSPAVTKAVSAMAQFDLDPTKQDDYYMAFEESSKLEKQVSKNTYGKFRSGPAPVIGLNFALVEASMDSFIVTIKESKPATAAYVNRAQPLKIEMSGEEGTLLLVFTQAGTDAAWQMASGGAKRNQILMVAGFGSAAKRVLVVPFAASLDGYADFPPTPKTKDLNLELTLPVGAEPLPLFDCSCLDAIYPLGTIRGITEPKDALSLETMEYAKFTYMGGFTSNEDNTLCQVPVEISVKEYIEDPYVVESITPFEFPVCMSWALCNGRTEYDQTGCPYATP